MSNSINYAPGRTDITWYKGSGPHTLSVTLSGSSPSVLSGGLKVLNSRTGATVATITGAVISVSNIEFTILAALAVDAGEYSYIIELTFVTGEIYPVVSGVFSAISTMGMHAGCTPLDGDVNITVEFAGTEMTINFTAPSLNYGDYTDDADAAANGVEVGGMYFLAVGSDLGTAGTLKKRVS